MNEILNYFLEHKLLAFILIVASIAHVWGFANLLSCKRTEFPRFGSPYVWFEAPPFKLFLYFSGWITGFIFVMILLWFGMKG